MMIFMKVTHTLEPIYNNDSKILILGSIPSIVSREKNFYYAHKTNRFWKILSVLFNEKLETNNEKKAFLLKNRIALWDVIKTCDIKNSSDSSIKDVTVNDINSIINNSNIKTIFCTGKKAYQLFKKYIHTNIEVICLSSPSSANAKTKLEDLVNEYQIIKKHLEK